VRLPPPLRPGDTVRVIAPSSPFDVAEYARGLGVLTGALGLRVRARADLAARRDYLAGDDARRIEEWREAVADPDARGIFCARGGFGAMRILPAVDPAPLLAAPKVLVGFSDIVALHVPLNRAGLATVHGPVVTQLGRAPEAAVRHLAALLAGDVAAPGAWEPPAPGAGLLGTRVIRPGRVSAPLAGGTLAMLAHLCGTPWQPRLEGAIVLLEDVGEKPYRLDRYLTQLRLAGALDGVAAVALGRFTDCSAAGIEGIDVVRAIVRELGVPAIEGIPAGHDDDNFALPLGPRATLVSPGPGEEGAPRLLFDGWSGRGSA